MSCYLSSIDLCRGEGNLIAEQASDHLGKLL